MGCVRRRILWRASAAARQLHALAVCVKSTSSYFKQSSLRIEADGLAHHLRWYKTLLGSSHDTSPPLTHAAHVTIAQGVLGGTVLLRKGQLSREVVILLHDNEEDAEDTREKAAVRSFNLVLKGVRNGELSTSRPTMCTVHVKSQNIDYTGFMDSKPFQVLGLRMRESDCGAHSLTDAATRLPCAGREDYSLELPSTLLSLARGWDSPPAKGERTVW